MNYLRFRVSLFVLFFLTSVFHQQSKASPLSLESSAINGKTARRAPFFVSSADKKTSDASQEKIALWRDLLELVTRGDDAKARALMTTNASVASQLYLELLFDAVDTTLYSNPPFAPEAAKVRQLLIEHSAPDSDERVLEAKFARWAQSKEKTAGEGFARDGTGAERVFYLYILAKARNDNKEAKPDEPKGSAAELTEEARALARKLNLELATASCAANLAYYAQHERRIKDAPANIAEASEIWTRWNHPLGLTIAAFLTGEQNFLTENWREAAASYARTAELAAQFPTLRGFRVVLFESLASARRSAGDKEGTRDALASAIEVLKTLLDETQANEKGQALKQTETANSNQEKSNPPNQNNANAVDERVKLTNKLAELEIQLGGALAALGRHAEAGEQYALADKQLAETYTVEREQLEKRLNDFEEKRKQVIANQTISAENRKTFLNAYDTARDALLTILDQTASKRHDSQARLSIAERRLAIARESNDAEKIAKGLEEVAKAHLALNDAPSARKFAEEALALRQADPRRRFLYDTYYLLGDIASAMNDWTDAITNYQQTIALAARDALPPAYDDSPAAQPNETIRATLTRMNNFDRANRTMRALFARLDIGYIDELKGNYRDASDEYRTVLQNIPTLYAMGAPDEAELLAWIGASGKNDKQSTRGESPSSELLPNELSIAEQLRAQIKAADVVAHRQANNLKTEKDENERLQFVELMANAVRGALLLKYASLYENEGDLNRAAQTYKDAIRLNESFLGGAFPLTGAYISLARIERERRNYAAAESPLASALDEYQRRHDAAGVAAILAQQSAVRLAQGDANGARRLAQDSLKIAETIGDKIQIANIERALGRAESEMSETKTLAPAERQKLLSQAEAHLRASLAVWRGYELRAHIIYTLSSLGLTLEREGRDADALAAYEEAVELLEAMSATSLSKDVSAETFNNNRANQEVYARLIRLLVKRKQTAEALRYLERAKAKALVDALAGAQIKTNDAHVDALLANARKMSDAARVFETELANELAKPDARRDAGRIAALRAQLAKARADYKNSVAELARANRAYASLIAVQPTDLDEVRRHLPAKTLLLSYFPTDEELYIFAVARDSEPTVSVVPIKHSALAQLISDFRSKMNPRSAKMETIAAQKNPAPISDKQTQILINQTSVQNEHAKNEAQSNAKSEQGEHAKGESHSNVKSEQRGLTLGGEDEASARNDGNSNLDKKGNARAIPPLAETTEKLYGALIAPVEAQISGAETLLIVPSSELFYLPFHALGKQPKYGGEIEYLIERKRIAYLASADLVNVLASNEKNVGASNQKNKTPARKGGELLALGNPDGSLPGASQEVAALGQIFNRAQIYTGAQATVQHIAQMSTTAVPFVHFATHGIINTFDPKESFLLLAGNPDRLSVRDLVENSYRISFEGAQLVTLSACNTNIGGWEPSAVYGSLSRAFEKAGAPSVVASLWSVHDEATRDLMTAFYKELANGQTKAEALRRAEISVRRNPRFANPYYWSPFVLLGAWE